MSVSVIIPCFNAEKFIAEAIDSILAQSLSDCEIIVVDDGSNDGSVPLVQAKYGQRVTMLTQSNKGAAAARNAGAKVASGQYLHFLDADDMVEPCFLMGLVDAIVSTRSDLALGRFLMIYPGGRTVEREPKLIGLSNDAKLASVLSDGWVAIHAILWRTEFFRTLGGFDETILINDDGELLFRALLAEPRVVSSYLDRAIYRHHCGERVSQRASRTAIVSQLSVLEGFLEALGPRARTSVLHNALSLSFYETARKLHELDYQDLAVKCEGMWRRIGPPYARSGSLTNRWASSLFGLKHKTALARAIRGMHRLRRPDDKHKSGWNGG